MKGDKTYSSSQYSGAKARLTLSWHIRSLRRMMELLIDHRDTLRIFWGSAPGLEPDKRLLGKAMIECAIVMPVIILIAFGGIEFSVFLVQNQKVASLSREITNVALRECAADAVMDRDGGTYGSACLQRAIAQFDTFVSSTMPGTTWAQVTIFYRPNNQMPFDRLAPFEFRGKASLGLPDSQFSPLDVAAVGPIFGPARFNLTDEISNHNLVVVGEVNAPFSSFLNIIATFAPELERIYEATVV